MKRWLFAGILILLASGVAWASGEEILNFQSDIALAADGSMTVRETIQVRCEGEEIRHGIYRDIPTVLRSSWFTRKSTPVNLMGVLCDGAAEEYRTERNGGNLRVYIGKPSVLLKPGVYTYTLTYATDRPLRFFKDHDELYWNVTGNDWTFPIQKASSTVTLPSAVSAKQLALEAYTGRRGAKGKDYTCEINTSGQPFFETSRLLDAKEGLTIVVSFPKGIFHEPTFSEQADSFLHDNASLPVGLVGLLVVLAYYYVVWLGVGRDPAKGVLVPLLEPPAGLSPAGMRYLARMGYDERCLCAAAISLAVKGQATIAQKAGQYTLSAVAQPGAASLPPEEEALLEELSVRRDGALKFCPENAGRIQSLVMTFKRLLAEQFDKRFFVRNTAWLAVGVALSLAVIFISGMLSSSSSVAGLFQGSSGTAFPFGFICVWVCGWSVGVFVLLHQVVLLWRGGQSAKAVPITLFAIPFVAGEVIGLVLFTAASSVFVLLLLLALAFVNILFFYLLRAYTRAGRQVMDEVEGFRRYLSATEQRELDLMHPPEETPQVFEKYLPYALALGVENRWSERFSAVIGQSALERGGYSPSWYSGASWTSAGGVGAFTSSLGGALAGAIASSSSTSSGSGGGGSSGGGGGGGGGGGW